MLTPKTRALLLWSVPALAVAGLLLYGRIPQDPHYHQFADAREIFGVVNGWNVLSNLPFVLAGAYGLWRCPRLTLAQNRAEYLALCLGVLWVGFGSGYYHHAPSDATLVWDRLPMTVVFMSFLSVLLNERVLPRPSGAALWLLLALGAGTVFYWHWTELQGRDDLRPYVFAQFTPILMMPVILLLYPGRYLRSALLLYAFALYAAAKLCESFDPQVYAMTAGFVSGHSLKHLLSALAALCIVCAVPVRGSHKAGAP